MLRGGCWTLSVLGTVSPAVAPLSRLCPPTQLAGMQYLRRCKDLVGFFHQLLLHSLGQEQQTRGQGISPGLSGTPFPPPSYLGNVKDLIWDMTRTGMMGTAEKVSFITGKKFLKHCRFKSL